MSILKRHAIRAAMLAGTTALCSPLSAAWAQDGAEASDAVQETIVVTASPIRDSQKAAIEAKRLSDNVMDVISADTIGRFPDQNLADSLGRLPGLGIERDQGQARYINFRGLPFRNTKIAFDGMDIPGAENGRTTRFDAFPSVITASVEANKAITPDMPGEAVAGYINIKTYNPFDNAGLHVSGEIGYGEQELGGGPVNKYNGRISWSNDMVGFSVFGSHNSRVQNTDNREYALARNEETGALTLSSIDFRSYFVEREDNAYGASFEAHPQNSVIDRVFASTLYSEFIDTEERNQYVFAMTAPVEGSTAQGVTVNTSLALEYGQYDNSTWTNTIGADLTLGDWSVEGRYNYTETADNLFLPIPRSVYGFASANYDITDLESPVLNLFATGTSTPITAADINFAATVGILYAGEFDINSHKIKLDAERETGLLGGAIVKLGFQHDARDGKGYVPSAAVLGFPVDPADYKTDTLWYTDFNNSIGGVYYDNKALRQAWEAAAGNLSPTVPDTARTSITENLTALYAMATTDFGRANLVYGVRAEMTDYTTDGYLVDASGTRASSYDDNYTNVLPSVHFNLDVTDSVKARLSYSTGVSRPNYNELRISASISPPVDTLHTVTGGNPALKAEESQGFDAALEWYAGDASLVSLGAFYRQVDNVIYASTQPIDGAIYADSTTINDDWQLKGFFNGKDGKVSGVELNIIADAADFIPLAALEGFGLSTNVTVLDSEFSTIEGDTYSLPGTSDLMWNASVYYERFGVSARVNYQYRDDWLSTTENDGLDEFWGAQQRVDASLRYQLPFSTAGATYTLFANANNLTNEVDVRYSETAATPNQVEGYGRYYLLGLRMDY